MTFWKLIRPFVILVCLCLLSTMPTVCQDGGKRNDKTDLKVKQDKPSIFITYERPGPRPPLRDDEKGFGIFLRLHNNLKASIRFCAFGISNGNQMSLYSETGEIGIKYDVYRDVEDSSLGKSSITKQRIKPVSTQPIGYLTDGLCHSYELPGGTALEFSIPAEHLLEGLSIRIPFNYQWEEVSEIKPLHFAIFSSSDLPSRF